MRLTILQSSSPATCDVDLLVGTRSRAVTSYEADWNFFMSDRKTLISNCLRRSSRVISHPLHKQNSQEHPMVMITKTSSSAVEVVKWIFTSMTDQIEEERHLLYILLDSNLPTGGFVASSGLESYSKHGFLSSSSTSQHLTPQEAVVRFAERSVTNYASSTLGFVRDAWAGLEKGRIEELIRLDEMYEAMTLNHVTRRSSTAQGVALLTLLTKGFSVPTMPNLDIGSRQEDSMLKYKTTINTFKLRIRRGEAHGHLPVCWGLLTRAMGLSLGK
jgi:urease accessory protein UreF